MLTSSPLACRYSPPRSSFLDYFPIPSILKSPRSSGRHLEAFFLMGRGAAPARDSQSRPGGPGRPSGSHYGEPAIAGRHGRNERQVKACASPVYRKRSGDRNRRCVERRQGGASCIGSPSRCGKRTPGEQNVFRTMLTRRQIRIAPCGAPPPRFFRGETMSTSAQIARGDDDACANAV